MAIAVRKILAEVLVGSPSAICAAVDDRLTGALDAATRPRAVSAPYVPTPVLAQPEIVALILDADGNAAGILALTMACLGFAGLDASRWYSTILDCEYQGAGFSGRELRGLVAARLGGRPDQIRLRYLDANEREIAARRRQARDDVFVPPAGWSMAFARKTFKKLGIEYSPGEPSATA